MSDLITTLWHDESGQDMAEYALLLTLIAIALVAAVVLFRDAIIDRFEETAEVIEQGEDAL